MVTRTYPLTRWCSRQPRLGERVAVLTRSLAGKVLSVKLAPVPSNCVALAGGLIGLGIYRGRAWPRFWLARVEIR